MLFIISAFSCTRDIQNKSSKTIAFKTIKTIKLPIPDSIETVVPQTIEYASIDNKPTLIIQYNGYSILYFYDLKQKKIYHTIPVKYPEILNFRVFSKDSILLYISNINFINNQYDSVLCFIDYSGQHYHFLNTNKNPYLWTSSFKDSVNHALAIKLNFDKFTIQNNRVFLPLSRYSLATNAIDDALNHKYFPLLGMFNLKSEHWLINKSFWYPGLKKGHYYPRDYLYVNSCLNGNNFPVFHFGYSLNLYEWNTTTNKVITHEIKSQLIDSIGSLKAPNPLVDITNAKAIDLYYDAFHKWYYSFVLMSEAYKYANILIVLDENFNVIAEALYPKVNYSNLIFKNDTIISWGYNYKEPDFLKIYYELPILKPVNFDTVKCALNKLYEPSLDVLRQGVCKLPQNNSDALAKVTPEDIKNVFKNQFHVQDSSFVLVHVFSDDGCYHCYERVLLFFSANQSYLKTKPCYLMVSGVNKGQLKQKLKFKDLYNFKNLIVDTNNLYRKKIHSINKNPRIFIFKNNNLTFDTVYPAEYTDSIFYRILDTFNFQYK